MKANRGVRRVNDSRDCKSYRAPVKAGKRDASATSRQA